MLKSYNRLNVISNDDVSIRIIFLFLEIVKICGRLFDLD